MSRQIAPEPIPTARAITCMSDHAREQYPREAVGFLVDADTFVPVKNVHPDPENAFRVSDDDFLKYEHSVALVHSHPYSDAFNPKAHRFGFGPECPSGDDMRSQAAFGKPFGIIVTDGTMARPPIFFGDFLLNRPLYGQTFIHGVEDCFLAIRKWFWQERGVYLPDAPRDVDWWLRDDDLYMRNFDSWGFTRLAGAHELKPGDVGLFRIGDRRIKCLNHGFVYLGDGTVYHHKPGHLSLREAVGPRVHDIANWFRHQELV